MKRLLICTYFFSLLFLLFSCQKELSLELKSSGAQGSLHSDATDECLPKTVSGSFIARKVLNDSNFVEIEIDVSKAGSYSIASDTVNGYSFHGTGNFTTTGINRIKLKGQGTPAVAGTNTFLINFDSTFCYIQVAVLPSGAGGPAVFTLQGSGSTCLDFNVQGSYVKGTALTASNKVDIKVDVTTVGTYSISTTATNGMTFTGTGTIANTGIQIITLNGSGTPVNSGNTTITVAAGASSCTFPINVTATAPPPPLNDYFPRTVRSNWSYRFDDDPLDTTLIKVDVSFFPALGNTYSVFMGTYDASMGFDTAGYYRKSASDYYQYLDIGSYLGFDSSSLWVEYVFLKDNQPAGFTWNTSAYTLTDAGTQYTLRLKLTILQKDVGVTVNSVSYPNTIVVEEKYEVLVGGSWIDLTSSGAGYFKNYYSKGVGLIKWEHIDGTGAVDIKYELTRYNIY